MVGAGQKSGHCSLGGDTGEHIEPHLGPPQLTVGNLMVVGSPLTVWG